MPRIVIGVQGLRAFAYGFGAVLIGSALASEGLSDLAVGGVFTVMLAGMAGSSLLVGRFGDAWGRRRTYCGLLAIMGLTGTVFALTTWYPALLLASLTGTLSANANESGPITSIEQALIAEEPHSIRARLYGRYNAVAYLSGAFGALAAAGPPALRALLPRLPADRLWLLLFPVIAAACVAVAGRLPEAPSRPPATERAHTDLSPASRRFIGRLAASFSVDAFAGGMVVQSFLVFWFERRFGASTQLMGVALFATGLLQAASSIIAGWMAPRVGLLETMVFTHIPSNVLLALVPLMPSLGAALGVLLARYALSQMDVPARQAFIAAAVAPGERGRAAAYTNSARYIGSPAGPAVGAALMQWVALAAPFVAAGTIKVAYDLTVYGLFRRVPLEGVSVAASSRHLENSSSHGVNMEGPTNAQDRGLGG